ncbi:MAG TPA: ATP-binding protein [Gemmatimonadales bacterium]|nr:ATP-binding protein [Gemmatimonadales bacterium]
MKLATRLFASTSLLVALTVLGLVVATEILLRRRLEAEVARALEREARLVAALLPADSAAWPQAAQRLGRDIERRITVVAPDGRVLGDTEFDRAALARLENHAGRPEIQGALESGTGRHRRRSASTNEGQMYVAVRGGPRGVAAVRVSTSLAAVDRQVQAVQWAVAGAGVLAVALAALLAWPLSRALARPLGQLTLAAREIAAGREPAFPDSRVPEIADQIVALRTMAADLAARFDTLRREREAVRALLESLADGVIATDPDGAVVAANTAARRLLGYSDTAPLPPLPELFHEKPARDVLDTALRGGEPVPAELHLGGRDLLVAARPLPGGGRSVFLRDVTTLRRLETVRRDFVANVSHELKTPLTSIAGYAETLARHPEITGEARQFAATILANARRMQRLVDDLLDLSRIESGAWLPEPEPVDLEGAVREAWAALGDRGAGRGVRLDTEMQPEAGRLRADPGALRQILTNLLDNAARHTPPGGRITVSAALAAGGVTVAIADTGSGIPAEHLPRIFERFYRVDPGRSRDQGGTGLGLAIVKHLVEAHGGRVEADSAPGNGTVIRMIFPP